MADRAENTTEMEIDALVFSDAEGGFYAVPVEELERFRLEGDALAAATAAAEDAEPEVAGFADSSAAWQKYNFWGSTIWTPKGPVFTHQSGARGPRR